MIDRSAMPSNSVPSDLAAVVLLARERASSAGFGNFIFAQRDIELLCSTDSRLNDICVNGCAALLHSESVHIGGDEVTPFAILSTHDLPRIRYHAADDDLWRNTSRSLYWEKPVWVLPIHRPSSWGHWVLCSIHFDSHRILLFDSLAEHMPWQNEICVSPKFPITTAVLTTIFTGHHRNHHSTLYHCMCTSRRYTAA
jgi:hypothetical protein